jgi:immunomodulating metalloprotease
VTIDPVAEALETCSSKNVTSSQLWHSIRARLSERLAGKDALSAGVYATLFPSPTSLTWDPTHDSVTFSSLDPEQNVPVLMSNDARDGSTQRLPLAMAGTVGTSRHLALASNMLAAAKAGDAADPLQQLATNAFAWLTQRQDLREGPFQVVLAHLPNAYWFPMEPQVKTWFAATYPNAKLNTTRCESTTLASCLQTADLLVISSDMGTDNKAAGPFQLQATLAAVRDARARGVPVLYLHYSRDPNELGRALLWSMGLVGTSNYWSKKGLKAADPSQFPRNQTIGQLADLTAALSPGGLQKSDYETCLGTVVNIDKCTQAEFQSKLMAGVRYLSSTLATLDGAGQSVCGDRLQLLQLFVLLADAYRTGDGETAAIKYPIDARSNPNAFARAVFADAVAPLVRPSAPPQTDPGTFICSTKARSQGMCTGFGYNISAVSRGVKELTVSLLLSDEWTTSGLYALPGIPFRVTRTDSSAGGTAIRVNFQRAATTHAFTDYARPQYLRSAPVWVAPGQTVTLTSPWGGPIYIETKGGAGHTASFKLEEVAEHVVLHTGDPESIASFPMRLALNPLPHVDIKSDSFEVHLRRDMLESTVQDSYGGNTALLVTDIVENFIGNVYQLAGFKIPGKSLTSTIAPDVRSVCAHFGWDCTDESLHLRTNIQHANFDGTAACGAGCSGNPFDADWAFHPIGWGENHELGHNLQTKALNIGWYANGAPVWKDWQNRAGENSNNIFPYHTLWNYQRNVKRNMGLVLDTHMNHRDLFAAVQSDEAALTRKSGGVTQKVIFDSRCNVLGHYDEQSTNNRGAAIWGSADYAAQNGLRMSFYLQLPLQLQGHTLADGTVLQNGFHIFTLLYDLSRIYARAAKSEASWNATKLQLGFGLFPYAGHAVYGGEQVRNIPGNDFMVVALSYITGLDYRLYFASRGVLISPLASQQVQAHVDSGHVTAMASTNLFTLATDLPAADLRSGLGTVSMSSVASWPSDGFSPSGCP